jgi:hypothetical protein
MENRVGHKSMQNYHNNCKKLKLESKLVYGVTTDDEKKPHTKFKVDITLNKNKDLDALLREIDVKNQEKSKNLSYDFQKREFIV